VSRARKNETQPGAVELIEEAVQLLRGAPASAWACYLAGVTPWLLGLAWFWASASWFAPRPAEILWRALGLAALFLWLKVWQAVFCARLRARRLGQAAPAASARGLARIAARQARVQGWTVPVLPVAGLLTVPAGVAWMFFENATALAATEDAPGDTLAGRALREAKRWPGPGHLALVLFSGLWLCAWVNVASTFYVVPWLARTLLGVDNLFALSGWSALNSTFLALVTALTWVAVDPLVKAYHVLRTFYGEARLTGEDLRLEIPRRAPGAGGRAGRAVVVALAVWVMGAGLAESGGGLRAEAVAGAPTAATPAEVDAALDAALREREFVWRLEPLPMPEAETGEDGPIKAFVRAGVEWLKQIVRDISDLFERLKDWLDGLFGEKKESPKKAERERGSGDYSAILRVMLYSLLALCALALAWIVWTGWKQQRRPAPRVLAAVSAVAVPPDLNDEKLEASRLPSDEWLALAREQMARGEWRLALRALYLATLAGLGAQGLVTLARAKTNLDYERELGRRAAGRAELVGGFRARRLAFERVWYGRDVAGEPEVRAWLGELERERRGEAGGGA
jgi:hypothetical protein